MENFKKQLDQAKSEPRLKIHSFHRYFGKLIPAIPRTAIRLFTVSPRDLVVDPFCGSGTTLVEAKAMGRDCLGIDLNPLAVLATRVKTTILDDQALKKQFDLLMDHALRDNGKDALEEAPFVINRDHWYNEDVINNLVVIKRNIEAHIDDRYKDFFRLCLSAANRDVSNSDPKHVFPGYSKRLRRLDENGQRVIDVFQTFEQKANSRIKAMHEFAHYTPNSISVKAMLGDAREIPQDIQDAALVVMNPPYISSIRYLETMKLEMYWLDMLTSSDQQKSLDQKGVGTERFGKGTYNQHQSIGWDQVDSITEQLFKEGNGKMSLTVAQYFKDMDKAFGEISRILRYSGHLVIKISDSNVRKLTVPTKDLFVETLTSNHGFVLKDCFKDPFKNRSLLTKRNYYSGRMDNDFILVLQKT